MSIRTHSTGISFTNAELLYSNLGNHTPSLPSGMYVRNVAPGVDLLVTNLTQYRAWNHHASFLNGQLLQINLETPHDDDTAVESNEVEFLFSLVDAKSGAPALLSEFQVTFFDLDQGDAEGNGRVHLGPRWE